MPVTVYVDDEQMPAGSGCGRWPTPRSRCVSSRPTPSDHRRAGHVVARQPALERGAQRPATTAAGTRWAIAGGAVGGPTGAETYVLIANTGTMPGTAACLGVFRGRLGVGQEVSLAAESRTSLPPSQFAPGTVGKRFSVLVEDSAHRQRPSSSSRPVRRPGGVTWAAGTAPWSPRA